MDKVREPLTDKVSVTIVNDTSDNVSVWEVQEKFVNVLPGLNAPPAPGISTYNMGVLPGTELRFRVAPPGMNPYEPVTGPLLGTYDATAVPVQQEAKLTAVVNPVAPRLPIKDWDKIKNTQDPSANTRNS
jgi:hypothetical protein